MWYTPEDPWHCFFLIQDIIMYVCALSTSLRGDYNEDSHIDIYQKRFLKWNACPQNVHTVQLVHFDTGHNYVCVCFVNFTKRWL